MSCKYPPSSKYRRKFVKTFVSEIENERKEMDENFYELYLSLFPSTSSNDFQTEQEKFCYKTFELESSEQVVTIKTHLQFNNVGLSTWEAGFFFAEYALNHPLLFNHKRILELGSGVGFTGCVLSRLSPSNLVLTDYTQPVINLLVENLRISNFSI